MAIILDSLEEPLNDVALLVQFGVEIMFYLEVFLVGDTNNCAVVL